MNCLRFTRLGEKYANESLLSSFSPPSRKKKKKKKKNVLDRLLFFSCVIFFIKKKRRKKEKQFSSVRSRSFVRKRISLSQRYDTRILLLPPRPVPRIARRPGRCCWWLRLKLLEFYMHVARSFSRKFFTTTIALRPRSTERYTLAHFSPLRIGMRGGEHSFIPLQDYFFPRPAQQPTPVPGFEPV